MSFTTSTPLQYRLYGHSTASSAHRSHQVLEVRLRCLRRQIYVSPQIIHETTPTPLNNALFHLPLRQLQDPLFSVTHFLSSFNIRAAVCDVIALHIASFITQISDGIGQTNFHIVADIRLETNPGWIDDGALVEETVVLEQPPPAMEKLEEINGDDLRDHCSICFKEIDCKKREVVKIVCGKVYRQSCISN